MRDERPSTRARTSRRLLLVAAIAIEAIVAIVARRRGYRLGRRTLVRCQRGHVFTTVWLPLASVKSLRLGWWRVQRCPLGHHWALVRPVRESDLTWRQRRQARARDLSLP